MVMVDKDGVKFNTTFWPFAPYEDCEGCEFVNFVGEVDDVEINRNICKMRAEDEDRFLFGDVPDDKLPPCMRD
jgi:hypothetical protein